jgi:hypothetical protein
LDPTGRGPADARRGFDAAPVDRKVFAILGSLNQPWRAQKICFAYSREAPSLAQLAASYAKGIVANHPFVDGNKRTAFTVAPSHS